MTDEHPTRHMTPDEFRVAGYAVVDWVARYLETLERFPVLSRVEPGAIRRQLPDAPPQDGEQLEAILADLDAIILPGITHWQAPQFYGYFPANASPPAILGDVVSSGLGVQGMLWSTSPACTELETHILDWLVGLLGLPPAFASGAGGGGVIQDTASSATLCAVLAARERATGFAANRTGLDRPLTAYASSQAHSSVEKAVGIAGIGKDRLRLIEVDDRFAMRPDMLDHAIRADREAGLTPCFVCATVGSTSVTAIDPVAAVGAVCREHGLWLHVDAALAGSAAICPEFRWVHDGVELADSYCFNPHKWLLTNFDCDCFYVADRQALIRTLTVTPEYLRNVASEAGVVFDYRDWHVPLGRRFRALKLWFVLRHYGVRGLQQHIRHHVHLTRMVAEWVRQDPDFHLAAPVTLNLVCFRHRRDDTFNERLLCELNASGKLFLTHTKIDGHLVLRLAIGGTYTLQRHVEAAWDTIRAAARLLAAGQP